MGRTIFETADLGRKVAELEYNKEAPIPGTERPEARQRLRKADSPVIVLFGGIDSAGRNETVST